MPSSRFTFNRKGISKQEDKYSCENNKNMTLTELRYIVALAQTKHFGKAAKICHVSQPTLSVAVSKLESTLGVILFERHHNDIRITEIGEKIVAQAQRALEEVLLIREIATQNKSQLNAPLKIGGIYTVAPYLFPKLIPKIKNHAPHMPLIIQEDFTANLRKKLQHGELDAIFITLPFTEAGVVKKALYSESLVVLMRKDHRLAVKKTITDADLKQENILLLGEGNCFRDQVIKVCRGCYKPGRDQQAIEGTSLETLRHMVVSGLGITILPSTATEIKYYDNILCVKPFKRKIPQRTIALAWRVSFPRTKAIDVIIDSIVDCNLNGICLIPN
jgi:LysR family hydrogen peroxide-inducible transcriptional activator